ENVTVCKKRLDDFKRLYFLPGAMLVCVREYEEQHIYFYAREAGLFYNTEDSSRNFLKRNNIMLAGIMAVIPALFAYQLEQVRGAAVDRVTAGGFGMSN
ncbi:MAG: hypothetical protein LBK66_10140, partial [Spirochaetaceae bacterium]|nr:hypothetical protein [Spirochaetaceae bacterium]